MNIESSDPRRLPMTDQEVLAEGLLSVGEACDFLSIGRSLLYELMDRRVLDTRQARQSPAHPQAGSRGGSCARAHTRCLDAVGATQS